MNPARLPASGFRHGSDPPAGARAERLVEAATTAVLDAQARTPALSELDLEAEIAMLEHEWVSLRGTAIHIERHGDDPVAPTVVVAHGLGDHARRQLPLAAALRAGGFNVLVVDRVGHGISAGRRGAATLEDDLGVLELAIALARARSRGPVALVGDSLGGIMSWYLLTREPDVEAVVCHCIGHPDVHPVPGFGRKAALLRALARVAPHARVPVTGIADYDHVALVPETKRYFEERSDPLFNFTVTARAVASYIGFRPGIAWERVEVPVLVMIGELDRMVTPGFTRRALERARPPRAELLELAGCGHQLFLDDLGSSRGPLTDWLRGHLSTSSGAELQRSG